VGLLKLCDGLGDEVIAGGVEVDQRLADRGVEGLGVETVGVAASLVRSAGG
jgi:hypothetical protein